jgi:hypothetical protein
MSQAATNVQDEFERDPELLQSMFTWFVVRTATTYPHATVSLSGIDHESKIVDAFLAERLCSLFAGPLYLPFQRNQRCSYYS